MDLMWMGMRVFVFVFEFEFEIVAGEDWHLKVKQLLLKLVTVLKVMLNLGLLVGVSWLALLFE